jgi:hypothetical protein
LLHLDRERLAVTDLPPPAIEHLYPFLVLFGVVIATFVAMIGGMWAGFSWLKRQIRETAQEMLSPVIERLAMVERTADAAHRRIDDWIGKKQ